MKPKRLVPLLVAILALVVSAGAFSCAAPMRASEYPSVVFPEVSDSGYSLDPEQDLQLPELPTGCEATALSTLLRLNGVDVGKIEVADALPKSGTDFVHAFWGDPYSVNGGCCMSPCAAETARMFLDGTGLMAYQTEGRGLSQLPKPCMVWTTIDLAEPQAIKTQGAYTMYYPSHCVVVLGIDGDTVRTIDPLKGFTDYPLDVFERVYEQVGAQAIYLGKE